MPIGVDDFGKLRTNHFYYVDKTGMVKELLANWGEVNLFTRPRRFGKSINMSMLKYFFEIGTDRSLFDGLAISKETKLCEEYMGQYPVISITLKQVTGATFEDAKNNIWDVISEEAIRYSALLKYEDVAEWDKSRLLDIINRKRGLESSLKFLSRLLNEHYGKKVIILIDEYDAPLQKAYENNYYDDMVGLIRQLAEQADSITRDQIGALIEGRTVRKKLVQDLTYRDMMNQPDNIWSILYTSGYLTHRARYEDGSCDLCIPNREVKSIFITKVDSWFIEKVLEDEDGLKEFFEVFVSGNAEALEDCLNYHIAESISYLDGGNYEDKETFYHGLLIGMFRTKKGWEIKSEREAGNGRADITVFDLRKKEAYIIEVKYSKENVDLTTDAQEAIDRINRLRYDQYFSQRLPKSIRHYGIAFCLKQCRVLTE